MTDEQEKMVRNVCATMALEGMELNAEEIENVKSIITGEKKSNKIVSELISKYKKK